MAKILITGAAGFMGSHLFDYLRGDHEVLGIDNYSLGEYDHENIMNICLVENKKDVELLVESFKPDILYHLASWAHEGLSQFAPIRITENNYNAYLNVLVPCIKHGVKRVVCFSSMSVYGAGKPPFDENDLRQPEDIYAISKTAMEEATEILSDVFNFEYTIVRPHNVYGERQKIDDPYRNVVGIFMNRIMKGQPPIIYGDGKQTRAFSYIEDVTPYVAKCGFLKKTNGEIINIGPDKEYTVNYLADCVLRAFGSDLEPIYYPERPKEVKHAYCSSTKAKRLLNYKTSVSLEEGVEAMADYVLKRGPKEFVYLDELELEADNTPTTWSNKEM